MIPTVPSDALSDSPYPCPDFMQQSDIRISLCNSSPPSSLYPYVVFYVTGISIFCRDSDTILLIPRRAFSLSNSPVLPILLHAYDCILCVFSFIFESRDSTPLPSINKPLCVPVHTHAATYTHTLRPKRKRPNCTWHFTGFWIFLSRAKNFDAGGACACVRVKQDEQRRGTCESWRTELRRKFRYDARLKRRIS